ncbi:MAG: hypothetical protein WCJ62_12875 [Flavobacterium sp.]
MKYIIKIVLLLLIITSCKSQVIKSKNSKKTKLESQINNQIITGAENSIEYLTILKDKKVGVVTNQTGVLFLKKRYVIASHPEICVKGFQIDTVSVVDFILRQGVKVDKIFAPESLKNKRSNMIELIKEAIIVIDIHN